MHWEKGKKERITREEKKGNEKEEFVHTQKKRQQRYDLTRKNYGGE